MQGVTTAKITKGPENAKQNLVKDCCISDFDRVYFRNKGSKRVNEQ